MVSKIFLLLLIGLFCFVLLSGCICPLMDGGNTNGNNLSNSNTETTGDSTIVIVDSGNTNNGGMSDPSKCRNLPPQQMADCLEKAMGG